MANKERNKRSSRKARSQERAEREALVEESQPTAKNVVKAEKKPKKRGALATYLSEVRTEMKRVTWPSKEELKSYSVAVVAMLIVFGAVVWAVDTLITGGIAGMTGLRTW